MQAETSRLQTILAAWAEVFGPTADALVLEIAGRIGASERPAFIALIETCPLRKDEDALCHSLVALCAAPASLPHGVKPASALGAVAGGALGAAVALPIGVVTCLTVSLAMHHPAQNSDAVMWGMIGAIKVAGGAIGARNGAFPSRGAHAVLRGLFGFLLGVVLGAILGLLSRFSGRGSWGFTARGRFRHGVGIWRHAAQRSDRRRSARFLDGPESLARVGKFTVAQRQSAHGRLAPAESCTSAYA